MQRQYQAWHTSRCLSGPSRRTVLERPPTRTPGLPTGLLVAVSAREEPGHLRPKLRMTIRLSRPETRGPKLGQTRTAVRRRDRRDAASLAPRRRQHHAGTRRSPSGYVGGESREFPNRDETDPKRDGLSGQAVLRLRGLERHPLRRGRCSVPPHHGKDRHRARPEACRWHRSRRFLRCARRRLR